MGLSSREPFARMVEDAPWLKSHSHIGSSPVQHASYLWANRRQINANDEVSETRKERNFKVRAGVEIETTANRGNVSDEGWDCRCAQHPGVRST